MKDALINVRRHFKPSVRAKLSADKVTEIMRQLDYLEHVLEFSATWNGVVTADYFPDEEKIREYLRSRDISRLGKFFANPFTDVAKELHAIGAEYPLLFRKLYEEYYLSAFRRRAAAKNILAPT